MLSAYEAPRAFDSAAAWSALMRIQAASAEIGEDALAGALDALAAAIEADRVIVLRGVESEHVRFGRRCGRDLRDDERDDLCRQAVDDARELGRCVHVRRELDRTDEVAELGITGALAAPLGGAEGGVLYADFRAALVSPDRARARALRVHRHGAT